MSLRVDIQIASVSPQVPRPKLIRGWALEALAAGARTAEVSVRVVDGPEGCELNRAYRAGSGATNVLSFPFDASACTEPPLLGDVVVCAPVVEREAAEQGKSVDAHFAHMVVHGTLHLLGYEHQGVEQAAAMEAIERCVLEKLGFADPYQGDEHE